ncbi:MAG: type II toxin-antitoxin system RelE/ParE family toxin [Patescibacteria group bacterium]
MYRRVITHSAKRALKKLPPYIREALVVATEILEINPYAGEKLSGSLHFLYSFHFKIRSTEYRVAYTLDHEQKLIIVHLAHTRENFYEKIRRLFR